MTNYINEKGVLCADQFNQAINKASYNLKYAIQWIREQGKLDESLNKGLGKLYADIFSEPPFNERFSEKDARQTFQKYFDNMACILTVNDTNDKPIAFMVSQPLTTKPDIVEIVKDAVDPKTTVYLADDGVRKDKRKQGISRSLKLLTLYGGQLTETKDMVLRTNIDNTIQINAVLKTGGEFMPDIFEDVASLRTNGNVETDKRCYMRYRLA